MATNIGTLHFATEKPRHVALHPTRPWAAVITKHNYDVIILNYHEQAEVTRFRITTLEEERREDVELQRSMVGDVSTPIDRTPPKLGQVQGVAFFDTNTIHYGLSALRGKDIRDVFQAASDADGTMHGVLGRYVVVVMEQRIALYSILNPSQQGTELNSTQIENKTFLCAEAINTGPYFAVGCSDGVVRLWNYETRAVMAIRITGPHTKGISQLTVYHRTPEAVYACCPTLFLGSVDGAVSAIALQGNSSAKWAFKVEWQSPKAHSDAIVSLSHSHALGQIVTLSVGGTLVVHDVRSGAELKRVAPSKKVVKVAQALHAGAHNKVLILCEHSHVYVMESTGALGEYADLSVVARKKDVHVYAAVAHPLLPSIVFITCNNGLVQLNTNAVEGISGATTSGFGAIVGTTTSTTIVFAKNGVLSPTDRSLGDNNVAVVASPTRKFYALLKRGSQLIEIYTDAHIAVSSSHPLSGNVMAWHLYADTFSILTVKGRVVVMAIKEGVISVVASDVVTVSPPTSIVGGRWLCVQYAAAGSADEMMQFYRWTGQSSVGGFVPKASLVLWDNRGTLCALVYDDRVVFMSVANRNFKLQGTSGVASVGHGMWYNGTLFVVTPTRVVALFPSPTGHIDTMELAFLDVAMHYGSIAANCVEEWCLTRPTVSLRPPGTLEVLGVVDANLALIDASRACHTLPLSNPALMCKLLAQGGNIQQALAGIERFHLAPDVFATFLQNRNEIAAATSVKGTSWATRLKLHLAASDMGAVARCLMDPAVTAATRVAAGEMIVIDCGVEGRPMPLEVLQVLRELSSS